MTNHRDIELANVSERDSLNSRDLAASEQAQLIPSASAGTTPAPVDLKSDNHISVQSQALWLLFWMAK
jgi:hypothetical protein